MRGSGLAPSPRRSKTAQSLPAETPAEGVGQGSIEERSRYGEPCAIKVAYIHTDLSSVLASAQSLHTVTPAGAGVGSEPR